MLSFLLDFLTLFFIVAGCALLWLNLRPKRPIIVMTRTFSHHQTSALTQSLFVEIKRNLAEAKAEESPERAPRSDNVVKFGLKAKGK